MNKLLQKYLKRIGRKGGMVKSEKKAAAARSNGRKGGRPKLHKKVLLFLFAIAISIPAVAFDMVSARIIGNMPTGEADFIGKADDGSPDVGYGVELSRNWLGLEFLHLNRGTVSSTEFVGNFNSEISGKTSAVLATMKWVGDNEKLNQFVSFGAGIAEHQFQASMSPRPGFPTGGIGSHMIADGTDTTTIMEIRWGLLFHKGGTDFGFDVGYIAVPTSHYDLTDDGKSIIGDRRISVRHTSITLSLSATYHFE